MTETLHDVVCRTLEQSGYMVMKPVEPTPLVDLIVAQERATYIDVKSSQRYSDTVCLTYSAWNQHRYLLGGNVLYVNHNLLTAWNRDLGEYDLLCWHGNPGKLFTVVTLGEPCLTDLFPFNG